MVPGGMLEPQPQNVLPGEGVIKNFIWGSKDAPARAKVKWDTLALPTAQGGLGVTDPKSQSEALLAKLLIRGLGVEPWKELVRHKADQTRLPVHGKGPTNPDLNWLLVTQHQSKCSGSHSLATRSSLAQVAPAWYKWSE
jgi:hypothetical protein